MKRFFLFLVSLTIFRATTLLAANDVGSIYAVLKEQRYNQTDNSGPVLKNEQPYRLEVHVSQAAGGMITSGTVTPPANGSVHTAQALVAQNDGAGSWSYEQKLNSLPALNAAFGDGSYSLHITGAKGTYNSQLLLSGEVYPAKCRSSRTPILATAFWSLIRPSPSWSLGTHLPLTAQMTLSCSIFSSAIRRTCAPAIPGS